MVFMQYDEALVIEILQQISDALVIIQRRCSYAKVEDDFTDTETGQDKLDGICMKLIAVGESLKNIDRITRNTLLSKYPHIEWKQIKGIRDVLSHHYFDLDASTIFEVCQDHIDDLHKTINQMIDDLSPAK